MPKHNALYVQSGGVTAVINASACGVIETARQHKHRIGKVYAGHNGIVGALHEDLIDTSRERAAAIAALRHTPGGAFGSCRFVLGDAHEHRDAYLRLIEVFRVHDIGYVFYNGGNGSMDTAHKLSRLAQTFDYPLISIGIPKTIDNDLMLTDSCPGFGSAAKYVAISVREAALDVASMAISTKVFVMEVMGRHAGWLAAATGLAAEQDGDAPHIILFPEIPLDEHALLQRVQATIERVGHCVLVVSEGLRNPAGRFVTESGEHDTAGQAQLGGAGRWIAELIKNRLGHKCHSAVADYLQRSARHIASKVDVEHAYAVGKAAVELALKGHNGVMPTIIRTSDAPYRWKIGTAPLARVAVTERKMPRHFIRRDGFGISAACRRYLVPLIQGEDYPPYRQGLPCYARLRNIRAPKKLETNFDGS